MRVGGFLRVYTLFHGLLAAATACDAHHCSAGGRVPARALGRLNGKSNNPLASENKTKPINIFMHWPQNRIFERRNHEKGPAIKKN